MTNRRAEALEVRQIAGQAAFNRPHPRHINNGDEQKFRHDEGTATTHETNNTDLANIEDKPSHMMSFTKGMPHDEDTGMISNPADFQQFVKAIDSGDERDFIDTPLFEGNWQSDKAQNGGNDVPVRGWESESAGLAFVLDGLDPQAVTMPPAPRLGGAELTAEMAEVYAQALLRDVPFHAMSAGVADAGSIVSNNKLTNLRTNPGDVNKVKDLTDKLNGLDWFNGTDLDLNAIEEERRRDVIITPSNAFRGITPGDEVGPYLSQFILVGNSGINGNDNGRSPKDGLISYGALTIQQQVRTARPNQDYMTTWNEWLDVQNGADLRGFEEYLNAPYDRRILTPRDLATYVHYDALYQAYLNACLILLGNGTPYDPGIPFQAPDALDHQQGFAHFGGPHILSLVTEVATRALKAVRFQKFNVHRRCRPEVLAARIYKADMLAEMSPELVAMKDQLDDSGIDLLSDVRSHNAAQSGAANGTELLPMAFCEGSPMHPAYGAGHATVAGACVTILKAFFDHEHHLNIVPQAEIPTGGLASSYYGYVTSSVAGNPLRVVPVLDQDCNPTQLTVEGELNKLASNISIGRNWAGVHYFTDYYESLLMGEQIALGILEEQKLIYNENFSMTIPLFNGDTIRI